MQTFLPYPDFRKSLQSLDYRRLGKQRVESMQIHNTITGKSKGWRSHPIVKMWQGYEKAMALYHNIAIEEWVKRGYKNNMAFIPVDEKDVKMPHWIGREELHASHRSKLLSKDYGFYSRYGWSEPSDLEYVWYRE